MNHPPPSMAFLRDRAAQHSHEDAITADSLYESFDLASLDTPDVNVPPPAYGESYGEIRGGKDGLGTSAQVTEDGRVNIRINSLNRRLSQIVIPALRRDVQEALQNEPPPPYVPPSLSGLPGQPPPPSLNIVIQIVGSRGDVQPFVALGKVLKDTYGHRVRLATHPAFKEFVEENGLEFFSIGGDPSRLMAFMVKNPSLMPSFRSVVDGDIQEQRRIVSQYIQGCWRSCYEAANDTETAAQRGNGPGQVDSDRPQSTTSAFVADCIIANPPSFAHIHCAEKLGIPLHIMFTMPYSATQAFPHPLANISSNADPRLTNYMSYAMMELLSWQGTGDIIKRFREKCLGLDPISRIWAPGMLQRLRIPHTYCWSPALIEKPKDWGAHIDISGFYLLQSANYEPSAELKAFLANGSTPIYIGFGSIVLKDPDALTRLILEAAQTTGQRVLLSKGWGGMGARDLPKDVFLLDNVPHDWLFKQVSCVVHHGGAGTTAAGITAGRPTIVVPFFGDQPFWGSMIARAGAGPDPIPFKQLTAYRLADAINTCLKPTIRLRAKELAQKIAQEAGVDTGAQFFHQYLEVDRLRCTLLPARVAVWRIRRTKIRLSAFAASSLINANVLDIKDLKLFRPCEYETDKGPYDPVSGGFFAACGAFGSMAMGLADIPSETVKAFRGSSKLNRQKSQEPIATRPSEREAGKPESTQTLTPQQCLFVPDAGPIPSPEAGSSRSNDRPDLPSVGSRSSSTVAVSDDAASQSSTSSGAKHIPSQDHDRLAQSFPHSSKGAGRFARALAQSPGEVAMSLTHGLHNLPKLWGDETVRSRSQVTDFASGAKAAGKGFGLGWYDAVTGLATQPYQGAQKDGALGFVKGVGKGVGGFLTKSGAGTVGILGYSMKGLQKEIQGLFADDVRTHIAASRTAQGYEEWLQSSEEQKQDVIARWNSIRTFLKMKDRHWADDMIRDALALHDKQAAASSSAPSHVSEPPASSTWAAEDSAPVSFSESSSLAVRSVRSSEDSLNIPIPGTQGWSQLSYTNAQELSRFPSPPQ